MSVARIHFSRFAARKGATLKCQKCGTEIAKGEQYRWYKKGFRSNYKYIRCMRAVCTPRMSELESSNMADAYAAIETAEDALDVLGGGSPEDNADSINSIVQDAGSEIDAVADTYREAAEAMGGAGAEMEEKADALADIMDELSNFEASESEPADDHEDHEQPEGESPIDRSACDECEDEKQQWWDNMIDEAREALAVDWP